MTDHLGKTDGSEADSLQRALSALSEAQQRAISKDARYRAIVENAVDAIITIDERGIIESANPSAVRLFGYSEAELVGRNVSILMPSPDREQHDGYLRRYLATGEARIIGIGRDVEGIKKSGERFWMRLSIGQSEQDGRAFFTGIIQDLTERMRAERALQEHAEHMEALNQELQRRRDETESQRRELADINGQLMIAMRHAQAAAEAKMQFAANMSHEIRTPLTAILGFLSVLDERKATLDADMTEAVEVIRRNGFHLLALIDDVLDFSKLEVGRLKLKWSRFNPLEVVKDVMAPMELRAAKKCLALRLECTSALPETIESDETRFRQVLDNLIDNAMKFTEVGDVTVSLGVTGDERDPLLRVCVADTGIGIDPSQAKELFEPFSQADTSMTRQFGGTGLGLSVCARLVKLLGGEISASGVPGRGSEFRFTIATGVPKAESNQEDNGAEPQSGSGATPDESRLDGRRVLLVEDGVDNQRLYQRFLTKAGAQVDLAINGSDAVAFMQNGRETNSVPDVIIMDMQMPVMDGYEATRSLRASNFGLPIIALTAHAMTYDRARCIEAGCDDYLSKPVDRKTLVGTILRWLKRPDDACAAVPPEMTGVRGPTGPLANDSLTGIKRQDCTRAGDSNRT